MTELNAEALSTLFTGARSHNAWLPKPIPDAIIRRMYDLLKWGPTSANTCPARFLFVKTPEGKERLLPCMAPMNVEKTKAAPVTAVIAYDAEFYDKLPKLMPHKDYRPMFADNKALSAETAFRNGSLQGAYLMLAARSLGLDCGPMSGFDKDKMDRAFFAGTAWRSNFVCSLGYGDAGKLFPRSPRLTFEEACKEV